MFVFRSFRFNWLKIFATNVQPKPSVQLVLSKNGDWRRSEVVKQCKLKYKKTWVFPMSVAIFCPAGPPCWILENWHTWLKSYQQTRSPIFMGLTFWVLFIRISPLCCMSKAKAGSFLVCWICKIYAFYLKCYIIRIDNRCSA